jgi:hypothetical protein
MHNEDNQPVVLNRIDHTPIANPDAVKILYADHLKIARRTWIVG